jgi:hypothetical protein
MYSSVKKNISWFKLITNIDSEEVYVKSYALWDVIHCSPVKMDWRFGGTYHLHLSDTFILHKQFYFIVSGLRIIGHGNTDSYLESSCSTTHKLSSKLRLTKVHTVELQCSIRCNTLYKHTIEIFWTFYFFFQWLHIPCGPWPHFFIFLIYTRAVGLLERVISSSQGLYLNTR